LRTWLSLTRPSVSATSRTVSRSGHWSPARPPLIDQASSLSTISTRRTTRSSRTRSSSPRRSKSSTCRYQSGSKYASVLQVKYSSYRTPRHPTYIRLHACMYMFHSQSRDGSQYPARGGGRLQQMRAQNQLANSPWSALSFSKPIVTRKMAAEQQVNLTDLEPIQLQEVKKQIDQVSPP
jgi:hypothetical protein